MTAMILLMMVALRFGPHRNEPDDRRPPNVTCSFCLCRCLGVTKQCSAPGCTSKHHAKGYCASHYRRHLGEKPIKAKLQPRVTKPKRGCSVKDCLNTHAAKGYCLLHVTRLRRGQPVEGPLRRVNVQPGAPRHCRKCGSSGPLVRSRETFKAECVACQNESYKARYALRKEAWTATKNAKAKETWHKDPVANRARVTAFRRRLAEAALNYLGGACRMCGETDFEVCHIDHIKGGGGAERRRGMLGPPLYRSILRGERDGELQVLCANCHRIKQKEERAESPQGAYRRRQRASALDLLGRRCRHCGLDDARVLEIDHIEGDGSRDRSNRRRNGSGYMVGQVLAGTEGRFQLLCANCNWRKRVSNQEHVGSHLKELRGPFIGVSV